MTSQTPAPSRLVRLSIVVAMVAAMMAAVPQAARGHTLCGPVDGFAATVASVLEAVNVFSPVADTSAATCPDQFSQVQPKEHRDWVGDQVAKSPTEAQLATSGKATNRGNKGADRGNKPRTHAACDDGIAAGQFECDNVNMWSHVSLAELGGGEHDITFINDIWGWTDSATRKDYALLGTSTGTVFVDISDKLRPVVNGFLPTASSAGGDFWRDIKVHEDHAFIGSENSNHGIQVFDLTRLRDFDGTYTTYDSDARYTGVGSSHNININTDTGYLFIVGAHPSQSMNDCGFGLHMVDVSEPTSPTFAGCWDGDGYVHDTQCVIYEGPDADYRGQELCFNSTPGVAGGPTNGSPSVSVTDVTDKANPARIFDAPYIGAYSHQGWLTEDQSTFYHGDEIDELATHTTTVTRVWDVNDLDAPVQTDPLIRGTAAIDHNMYTEGDLMYQSNYTSGLRITDVSDPTNPVEVGFFDIYPENDDASFEGGSWSNYPYFRQPNVVAVSSIDRGLFILQPALDE